MNVIHFSAGPGTVTGRGCSTKDKVFYKECETHQSDQVEIMCFCSYFLCNGGSTITKTGPKNVFSLVWFIIVVAVLNKTLNSFNYTQYHVYKNSPNNKKKSSRKLVHSKQTSSAVYSNHQNQMFLENVCLVFDKWKYGRWQNASQADVSTISEYYNDQNMTKGQGNLKYTAFKRIISACSKDLLDNTVNEHEQLIKKEQKECQPLLQNEYASKIEYLPLVKFVFPNDAGSIDMFYGKRKMNLLSFLSTRIALEPVTTGS